MGDSELKSNLFSKKFDAGFYLFTYIVFPVVSTFIGLNSLTEEPNSLPYWYLTILCNALCCFHDCINRWDKNDGVKNGKLFIMGITIICIIVYSATEMFFTLNRLMYRFDYILLAYAVVIKIACSDIYGLFYSEVCFR